MPLKVQAQLRRLTLALESPGYSGSGMNAMLRHWKNHFDVWCAFEGDTVVAWCLRTHTTEGAGRGWDWQEPREGEIMTYVHPDYRRMGIGSMLVEAVDEAHGAGIMFQWDEKSTGFYETVLPEWENAY